MGSTKLSVSDASLTNWFIYWNNNNNNKKQSVFETRNCLYDRLFPNSNGQP